MIVYYYVVMTTKKYIRELDRKEDVSRLQISSVDGTYEAHIYGNSNVRIYENGAQLDSDLTVRFVNDLRNSAEQDSDISVYVNRILSAMGEKPVTVEVQEEPVYNVNVRPEFKTAFKQFTGYNDSHRDVDPVLAKYNLKVEGRTKHVYITNDNGRSVTISNTTNQGAGNNIVTDIFRDLLNPDGTHKE